MLLTLPSLALSQEVLLETEFTKKRPFNFFFGANFDSSEAQDATLVVEQGTKRFRFGKLKLNGKTVFRINRNFRGQDRIEFPVSLKKGKNSIRAFLIGRRRASLSIRVEVEDSGSDLLGSGLVAVPRHFSTASPTAVTFVADLSTELVVYQLEK